MPDRFNILVVWSDGAEELLSSGIEGPPAVFNSKRAAQEQVEFMRMGMDDDDDVQSISIVKQERTTQ